MIHTLARTIANLSIFLEFSSEEAVNEDSALQALEQMGADLLELDEQDRRELSDVFRSISNEYKGEHKEYVATLPYSIGFEDDED